MITDMESWCLRFGWVARDSDYYRYGGDLNKRPTHIEETTFHSLEAALKWPARGTWWEISAPDGQVVVSSAKGFDSDAHPSPSFCARQILNARRLTHFPEVEIEDELASSLVSHDDGETWAPALLGTRGSVSARNRPTKARPTRVSGQTTVMVENGKATISHATGHATVISSLVEFRQTKNKLYDVVILEDDKSGHAKGVYLSGVSADAADTAHGLGLTVVDLDTETESLGRNGAKPLPKAWKPGLFEITQMTDGISSKLPVRGFIRGALGIDRRTVEVEGYGGHKYQTMLWHLTHIPTGALIVKSKKRAQAEGIADGLREQIPELTDDKTAEVTPEIGKRASSVIAEMKESNRRWSWEVS